MSDHAESMSTGPGAWRGFTCGICGAHSALDEELVGFSAREGTTSACAWCAENDGFVTPDVVVGLAERLTAAGKAHDFTTYEGVEHAFFNDTRPDVYHADAAADAWSRTIEFLRANLA